MSDQANQKAWERLQQNAEYLEKYQEWCSRQFLFYKFTGGFFTWEDRPLNESGQKYAGDLFDIMFTERTVNQDSQYRTELREAISEVEDMEFLEPNSFSFLKAGVTAMVERLEYLSVCNKGNFQPEIPSKGNVEFSKSAFQNEFQKALNFSMSSTWLHLIEAARPYSPFGPGLWPLDPHSDYEEVKRYDLRNPDGAASVAEISEDGKTLLVKIDPQMPGKLITERIKLIVQAVREKHGIKKAVGSGTLAGVRRGMFWASKEVLEKMEEDFRKGRSLAHIARKYYDRLRREEGEKKEPPLEYYIRDITRSAVYRRISRWAKDLDIE